MTCLMGSGKTTRLYSALKEINKTEDKTLTAEDPVENDLEGIIQLPINEGIGMTFGLCASRVSSSGPRYHHAWRDP
ncbi:MAG: ATPase, T2SS/T4P/T4SS family [Victivallales bacterium]